MKKLWLLCLWLISFSLEAQILNPVSWSNTYKQVSDTEFDLIFTAKIDEGWTVYSQFLESEDGPVATKFYFDEGSHFELVGKTKESGTVKKGYDKTFEMNLTKIYKKGIFTQRVRVKDFSKPIAGAINYMTCDDERCLPPTDEEFAFQLSSPTEKGTPDKATAKKELTNQVKTNNDRELLPQQAEAITAQQPTLTTPNNILQPVHWSGEVKKITGTEFVVIFRAKMDGDWHIYSQFVKDNGPIPTAFYFKKDSKAQFIDKGKEEGLQRIQSFEEVFAMEVVKFKREVTFTKRVKVMDTNQAVEGSIEYMSCNKEKCMPLETLFKITFTELNLTFYNKETSVLSIETTAIKNANTILFGSLPKPDLSNPVTFCGEAIVAQGKGYWTIFLLGFLGGLIALLTPCVFPMIPLTVSFFIKSTDNRRRGIANASLYGFFIFAVYLLLSLPFHLLNNVNPDILNDISTNVWLNIAFFIILLVFAFSFFGYYELTLPNSWVNRTSSAEGIGGVIGIFFMALTLALISFSCTGPILGSLLAGALSSDGGAWQLTAGMGGFGLALALPFALFAGFPSMIRSLPKSGSWLNTVKVVLGFTEIALAFKFLSNADLVKNWGILKIEPFLGIWLLISLSLAAYLFGLIKFPHDSPFKKFSVTRIVLGLMSVAFAIYLTTGFIYDEKADSLRSLKLLSGMAPPTCYSWLYPCDCPQNLNCFRDLKTGMAYAKKVGKPVMIDFTGHACVNCRKMEENVWPTPQVYKLLKDDYVLISLYVDEKIKLPENEQIEVPKYNGGTRIMLNYGHKWSHLQLEYFDKIAQPLYVLLSPDGHLLNHPIEYTTDADEYVSFLQCGLDAYKRLTRH